MSPVTPALRRRAALPLAAFALAGAGAGALALTGPDDASARCVDEIGGKLVPCPTPITYPTKVAHVGTVAVRRGATLGVRATPRQHAHQYRQLKPGAKVLIVCQTRGSKVKGTYGPTRIWNRLKHGGWVSDAYVYTGSNGRVAPNCPTR